MDFIHTDFLIIGSGLAGLYAAQYAAKRGSVLIVTKASRETSNSWKAQGGIAAAVGDDDAPDFHLEDTLVAGRGLCNIEAVRVLVEEGKREVEALITMGMAFDRDSYGELLLGLEGGHGKRRVLHAGGDSTGYAVTKFLLDQVRQNPRVKWLENTMVAELTTEGKQCFGATVFDLHQQQTFSIQAANTILASGGAGAIFGRTTNPSTATGDGMALAYQAGAELRDMEFMQFHPTALYIPGERAFLISEAVRGEGAYLVNAAGERFMVGRHSLNELAPRDVVAQAIHEQIVSSGKPCVYLKLDHLDANKIKVRFATIGAELRKFGIDMARDPIPVAPAAHYTIGGVKTDLDGRTSVANLLAVGEVASTGVHGANRLASNSLLECLVFGKRAALASSKRAYRDTLLRENMPEDKFYLDAVKQEASETFQKQLGLLMNAKVGIVRNNESLVQALLEIDRLMVTFGAAAGEIYGHRVRALSLVAKAITRGAQLREESRGAHLSTSYPEEAKVLYHTCQQRDAAGRKVHRVIKL